VLFRDPKALEHGRKRFRRIIDAARGTKKKR
jgi:hypothetical protein